VFRCRLTSREVFLLKGRSRSLVVNCQWPLRPRNTSPKLLRNSTLSVQFLQVGLQMGVVISATSVRLGGWRFWSLAEQCLIRRHGQAFFLSQMPPLMHKLFDPFGLFQSYSKDVVPLRFFFVFYKRTFVTKLKKFLWTVAFGMWPAEIYRRFQVYLKHR
jgi:hypothetical protein